MTEKSRKKEKEIVEGRRKAHGTGRGLLQGLFAVVIIILGIAGAIVLIKFQKPPQREEHEVLAPSIRNSRLGALSLAVSRY